MSGSQTKLEELGRRFQQLELHAARGGRELRQLLIEMVDENSEKTPQEFNSILQYQISTILPAIPPYAPPLNAINQLLVLLESAAEKQKSLLSVMEKLTGLWQTTLIPEEVAHNIAIYLLPRIPDHATIYTHTLSETILNVLSLLRDQGKISRIFVTESRPNNDGRDTALRLANSRLEVYLTIDAAMPEVIQQADLMISGAEMIDRDGFVIGKVGAFPAAVFCLMYGKPLYIIADSSKASPLQITDLPFTPLRKQDLGIPSDHMTLKVAGSYFDVTPPDHIQTYYSERGSANAQQIANELAGQPVSQWLQKQMANIRNNI